VRRRLFNLAAAVSFMLCLTVSALWVRSYFHGDQLMWYPVWRTEGLTLYRVPVAVASSRCQLSFRVDRLHQECSSHAEFVGLVTEQESKGRLRFDSWENPPVMLYGFGGRWASWGFGSWRFPNSTVVAVPHWLLSLMLSALPAFWGIRAVRHREKSGCCPSCGYDLRATPERCPECGTVPEESP
jgi:hypothetical protein